MVAILEVTPPFDSLYYDKQGVKEVFAVKTH